MSRLIDADKLIEENKETIICDLCEGHYDILLKDIIDDAPTVKAIVIPEGATNGDVIKAVFPNATFHGSRMFVETDIDDTVFNKWWWNAPYGGEKR